MQVQPESKTNHIPVQGREISGHDACQNRRTTARCGYRGKSRKTAEAERGEKSRHVQKRRDHIQLRPHDDNTAAARHPRMAPVGQRRQIHHPSPAGRRSVGQGNDGTYQEAHGRVHEAPRQDRNARTHQTAGKTVRIHLQGSEDNLRTEKLGELHGKTKH